MSTTHTRLVRRIAMLTSALSLASMLGACSSPLAAVGTGSGADDRYDATTTTDATTKRFAACLTGKGFDARTAAGVSSGSGSGKQAPTKNAVALRMIGTDGKPVASQGNSLSASDDGPQLYPNAAYTSMEDDSTWVVFKDAKALAGSPYESKQREYADCEAKNTDFTQPIPDMGPQHQYSGEDKQAALAYAQAARKKGFDWVKDPDADTPTSITIPGTVSESELRRFLKECPTDGANISYVFAGTTEEFGYDYNKVLSEFTSGSASTEAAPQQ